MESISGTSVLSDSSVSPSDLSGTSEVRVSVRLIRQDERERKSSILSLWQYLQE